MLLSSLLTKSLAVKVVLGVAGISATGVGVAAETGSLPAPVQQVAYQVAGGLGVPAATSGGTVRAADDAGATPEPSGSPEPSESPEPGSSAGPTAGPTPEPSGDRGGPDAIGPAAKGLCRAYHAGHRPGGSADSTAFRALAVAAASAGGVDAYCARILGSPAPVPSASVSSRHSDRSTPHPSGDPGGKDRHGTGTASPAPPSGHGSGHDSGHGPR